MNDRINVKNNVYFHRWRILAERSGSGCHGYNSLDRHDNTACYLGEICLVMHACQCLFDMEDLLYVLDCKTYPQAITQSNPNPSQTCDFQSKSNPLYWIANQIEQSSNPIH